MARFWQSLKGSASGLRMRGAAMRGGAFAGALALLLAGCQTGAPGGARSNPDDVPGGPRSGAFVIPAAGQTFIYQVSRNGVAGDRVATTINGAQGYRINASRPGAGSFSVVLFCVWCGHPATQSYTPNYNDVWPLRAGTSLTVTSIDGQGQQLDNTIRVVGLETVRVPAGSFTAWRVEEGAGGGGFARTTWWAPQLGYVVKTQITRGDEAGETRVLVSVQ